MASSSEQTAAAVVAALNSAALGVTFTRARFPKYSLKDIATIKAHVVAVFPARQSATDEGGSLETETPVAITIDQACEKTNVALVDELTELLEAIAAHLNRNEIAGIGYPTEPVTIDRVEDLLDQGHFCGGVGAVYRRFKGYDE